MNYSKYQRLSGGWACAFGRLLSGVMIISWLFSGLGVQAAALEGETSGSTRQPGASRLEQGDLALPQEASSDWWSAAQAYIQSDVRAAERAPEAQSYNWRKEGEFDDDYFGFAIDSAGDVNGDGFADIIIGAKDYDNSTGKFYIFHGSASGLQATSAYSATFGQNGDNLGFAVAGAGDVNGDGYSDVIIGAPGAQGSSRAPSAPDNGWGRGRARVFFGSSQGISSTPSSWFAEGENDSDGFGFSVAGAGDVNGDGYADVLVGAPNYSAGKGAVYLYLGSNSGLPYAHTVSLYGALAGDQFGYALAGAGDVDGDGYDDALVGAPAKDVGRGVVALYRGSASVPFLLLAKTISGEKTGSAFGKALDGAGDVNGDRLADVIIGAPGYTQDGASQGKAYLYLGQGDSPYLTRFWSAVGKAAGDEFGASVSGLGDVNGDGYADLMIGAPRNDDSGTDAGKAYAYLGSAAGPAASPDIDEAGRDLGDEFAGAVAGAGDVNGDGYADLIVGATGFQVTLTSAPAAGGHQGAVYAFYGAAVKPKPPIYWSALGSGHDENFGVSVAGAGDVNGDGYEDAIIGASGVNTFAGKAYLFLGSRGGLGWTPVWEAAGEAQYDYFGDAVAGAGDVNNDGYDDVAIGAYGNNSQAGKAYLYYGSADGLGLTPDWSYSGGNRTGWSLDGAGDVDDDGIDDLIVGAANLDGAVYVFYGDTVANGGLHTSYDWSKVGLTSNENFGSSVAGVGDVDGDGVDDVAIGAEGYYNFSDNNAGRAYLFKGTASGLSNSASWYVYSEGAGQRFGAKVAGAGDVDGDGYMDVLISAPLYTTSTDQGKAYLYLGQNTTAGLSATPDWSFTGEHNQDYLVGVSSAGDVNQDGYADVILGAFQYEDPGGSNRGKAYLFYGSDSGLETTPAWTQVGEADAGYYGFAVAGLGNVNADGYADLIVGAVYFGGGRSGKAYAYYGSHYGLPQPLVGEGDDARFGQELTGVGDVNRDGYTDLLVGAPYYNAATGKAYLFLGSEWGLYSSPAWTMQGENAGDQFGSALALADVDGNGWSDVVVGAQDYNGNGAGSYTGKAYVFTSTAQALSTSPAWTAIGEQNGSAFGSELANAGDVNGDGYTDIAIGAYSFDGAVVDSNRGKIYLYYGSARGLGADPDWSKAGENNYHSFGYSLAGAGDVNGDGYADLLTAATGYDSHRGKVYLYHGSATGLAATPNWSKEGEATNNYFGVALDAAGDVNADGFADVVIGASWFSGPGTHAGKAYAFYGSTGGLGDTPNWTHLGDEAAEAYFGASVAGAGDVNGDGYADVLVGAPYTAGGSEVGDVFLYLGASSGLMTTSRWQAEGENAGDQFGLRMAALGDVNNDGYADFAVGAPMFDDLGSARGKVYEYLGGGGNGRGVGALQARADTTLLLKPQDPQKHWPLIQPWSRTFSITSFSALMKLPNPSGLGLVMFQFQFCPPGVAFGHSSCQEYFYGWIDSSTFSVLPILETMKGNTLYRWRVRLLYAPYHGTEIGITLPAYPAHAPWRRFYAQAIEADFRTDANKVYLPLVRK